MKPTSHWPKLLQDFCCATNSSHLSWVNFKCSSASLPKKVSCAGNRTKMVNILSFTLLLEWLSDDPLMDLNSFKWLRMLAYASPWLALTYLSQFDAPCRPKYFYILLSLPCPTSSSSGYSWKCTNPSWKKSCAMLEKPTLKPTEKKKYIFKNKTVGKSFSHRVPPLPVKLIQFTCTSGRKQFWSVHRIKWDRKLHVVATFFKDNKWKLNIISFKKRKQWKINKKKTYTIQDSVSHFIFVPPWHKQLPAALLRHFFGTSRAASTERMVKCDELTMLIWLLIWHLLYVLLKMYDLLDMCLVDSTNKNGRTELVPNWLLLLDPGPRSATGPHWVPPHSADKNARRASGRDLAIQLVTQNCDGRKFRHVGAAQRLGSASRREI